ncbi:SDR family oxidoreductase [Nocardioides acrostichi]|uniref:SDR family oxidoreductase n=1 Tax=Nocardioides acrostichi TaxID=2784339 RepID=A0A930UXW5_9ACTN|nr:SDR family oxidoreductase [Nocardioides acrostichi]MBF4162131.1 SDR family oxidoreductase [Nocardioides acrostichi]
MTDCAPGPLARARDAAVVVGVGEMGLAIARRIGRGRRLLIADRSASILERGAAELGNAGYDVTPLAVDVADASSVYALAAACADLGAVVALVHTAGVSPVHASVEQILVVDVLGTALVLDAFEPVMRGGGAAVVIASVAASIFPQPTEDLRRHLALAPTGELLSHPGLEAATLGREEAYALAKQANIARVAARSLDWGRRGTRLNAVSPGVIATALGRAELEGPSGAIMRTMIEASGTGRIGTADDVAAACDFLLGDDASFVTGTNLLVDGGVSAAWHSG